MEILRDNGFEVVGEAGDGETAVALATELRPDLVIMDVKMPQLDGISAAERLSKNHIAPVVLLTAFSQKELVERASEAGALAYVVKPFTPNDLLPAIEIALSPLRSRSSRSRPRSPTWSSASRPASSSTAPRACSTRRWASASPRRSAGSRRRPWTAA